MHLILDLVSRNRVAEILKQLHKEGVDTQVGASDRTDGALLIDEEDLPRALEILRRLGI